MPTNLPEIKQLLANWYLLAVDNALFVCSLILLVWGLLALLYNLKMLGLKKEQKTAQKLHLEVQDKLTTVEQQVQEQEAKHAVDAEQMLKDKQFIEEIQEKLLERNQNIVENIKALAGKFDLNEQLVDSDKTMQDEFIWQQQDNIIQQLSDRLSAAQQENEQAGEKDSLIRNLQNSLDTQIKQFAQLEQAIEVQKHVQHEQQKEVQQQLNNTLEKHQLDFIQLIETVQNRSVPADVKAEFTHTSEPIVQQQEAEQPDNIAEQKIVEFNAVEQVSPVEQINPVELVRPTGMDSQQTTPEILDSVSELEDMLEQRVKEEPSVAVSIQPPIEEQEEPASEPDSLVQDLLDIAEPTFSTTAENEAQHAAITDRAEETKSSLNVAGKFKGLLGKVKKSDTKSKVVDSSDTLTSDTTDKPTNVSGKLKGLLGKVKKSSAEVQISPEAIPEPEQQIEQFAAEDFKVPEAEQQIETFVTEDFKESEVEDVHVEPDYGTSNFKMPGALTKLFGKAKK